jgi:3-hydroxyacyl-CoA dehydrogenase
MTNDLGTIGIVGAGAKGRDAAVYALLAGYRVILEDISALRLSESGMHVSAALDAAVARGELDALRSREIAGNILASQSIDHVSRGADLLIEAAPEEAELQLEMFTIFDRFARPQAILASTTRSVSITDLAEMTNCPERCVGLQFPEPAETNKQLRILCAPKTGERTVSICTSFARRIGLEPEIVNAAEKSAFAAGESRKP